MIEYKVLAGRGTYLSDTVNPLAEQGYRILNVGSYNNDKMIVSLVKDDYSRPTKDYKFQVESNLTRLNTYVNEMLAQGYKLDGVSFGGSYYTGVAMHKEYDPVVEYVILDNPNGEPIEEHIKEKAEQGFILDEIVSAGNYTFAVAVMKRLK